jgi:hypothetical protein
VGNRKRNPLKPRRHHPSRGSGGSAGGSTALVRSAPRPSYSLKLGYGKYTAKLKYSGGGKESIIKPPPSGVSHSYAKLKYKPCKFDKLYMNMLEPSTYETTFFGTLVSLIGRQGVQNVTSGYTGYLTTTTGIPTIQDLFNQSSRSYEGAASAIYSTIQTNQKSFKILLSNSIYTTLFTNQGIIF